MSAVTVVYGLKSLKVKTSPGTPAAEILDRAATHFKLDSATFALLLV